MPRPKKSLSEAISKELKSGFNLDSFKDKKALIQMLNSKNKSGYHYPRLFLTYFLSPESP
jgi:hypothetical protein